ncbi:membrane protein [Pantoea rodasii]|uniref:Membrane protein n=2 Tax=Pantoea rodasii TaxID=1076549 RepID=A0A0B1R201_9GAMM|nr:membrane protein [Pantoea rodasii]
MEDHLSLKTQPAYRDNKRSFISAVPLGVGIMAAVDEIIFHQLLAWHHFFDWGTPAFSLFSDGLLHAAELIAFVAGAFMLHNLIRHQTLCRLSAWSGFFTGLGGFQLFDGIVDHKLLRLHQIRYVDNLLTYDLIWNGAGLLMLSVGWLLYRHSRSAAG